MINKISISSSYESNYLQYVYVMKNNRIFSVPSIYKVLIDNGFRLKRKKQKIQLQEIAHLCNYTSKQ